MESVFTTKNLEKAPLAEVEVFIPPEEVGTCPLTPEERELFNATMKRLADKVRAIFLLS